MKSTIALVGRPNVGKSTLFNLLTGTRRALVADEPGLTRDRLYGTSIFGERDCIIVDTGGLTDEKHGIDKLISEQSIRAAEESDLVLFLVDARSGLQVDDQNIALQLRKLQKPIILLLNKSEGLDRHIITSDFYSLGLGEPVLISAAHSRGREALTEAVLQTLPELLRIDEELTDDSDRISVAILGRPNVGKSTLINRIIGDERVIAFDLPGTTRDAIEVPFDREGKNYTLIDTAGIRRRSRVNEKIEKFSVIKTIQAIEKSNVVVLVMDGHETITEQDVTLLGMILDSGRALVIAVNKWDGLDNDDRTWIKRELDRKLKFIDFAKIHFISALHGSGVGNLFGSINKAYQSAMIKVSTPKLNRIIEEAVESHPPPLVRGRRIKLRYAHMAGQNPPMFLIYGNQVKSLPGSYKRYLSNVLIKTLKLSGTPVKLEFRQGTNPFENTTKKALRPKSHDKK